MIRLKMNASTRTLPAVDRGDRRLSDLDDSDAHSSGNSSPFLQVATPVQATPFNALSASTQRVMLAHSPTSIQFTSMTLPSAEPPAGQTRSAVATALLANTDPSRPYRNRRLLAIAPLTHPRGRPGTGLAPRRIPYFDSSARENRNMNPFDPYARGGVPLSSPAAPPSAWNTPGLRVNNRNFRRPWRTVHPADRMACVKYESSEVVSSHAARTGNATGPLMFTLQESVPRAMRLLERRQTRLYERRLNCPFSGLPPLGNEQQGLHWSMKRLQAAVRHDFRRRYQSWNIWSVPTLGPSFVDKEAWEARLGRERSMHHQLLGI